MIQERTFILLIYAAIINSLYATTRPPQVSTTVTPAAQSIAINKQNQKIICGPGQAVSGLSFKKTSDEYRIYKVDCLNFTHLLPVIKNLGCDFSCTNELSFVRNANGRNHARGRSMEIIRSSVGSMFCMIDLKRLSRKQALSRFFDAPFDPVSHNSENEKPSPLSFSCMVIGVPMAAMIASFCPKKRLRRYRLPIGEF